MFQNYWWIKTQFIDDAQYNCENVWDELNAGDEVKSDIVCKITE